MWYLKKSKGSPLHQAVVANNLSQVKVLAADQELLHETNGLGFTPLEIAKLLHRTACEEILNSKEVSMIQVISKSNQKERFTRQQFRNFFGVEYLSHLSFASYEDLQKIIAHCPWILQEWFLGKEHWALGRRYQQELALGTVANIEIRWIDRNIRYGLFAGEDFSVGTFIGEYTGYVRQLNRYRPDHNGYCFHYPTKYWSWDYYVVDALKGGNETRFINHSDFPNLEPLCLVDRGLLHLVFRTKGNVKKGEQLTFDYGKDYWQKRNIKKGNLVSRLP